MTKQKAQHWPHLQELLNNDGSINIGTIAPLSTCAAVATQQRNVCAQLLSRQGEQLTDLLDRLDAAVVTAIYDGIYTDEINR